MTKPHQWMALAALCLSVAAAHAQTLVKDAWVRGTVASQKSSGAFMEITSMKGGKLVAASSPVAGVVEVHEMKMDGSVMKMGPVASVALPAGKPVKLEPGHFHIMLMDLKQPLKAGDMVPLTLTVVGSDGKPELVDVKAMVRPLGGDMPMHEHGEHDHMHMDMK
jgi:periplasmic copper chaperone A